MRATMFASMLAAVCASPHRSIQQSASSAIQNIQSALPSTHFTPVSIRSFSPVAQSHDAVEAAHSTTFPLPSPASVTPSSVPPASVPPSSVPPASAPPSDYAATVVKHHNAHRANHSAPEITWDDGLAATAYKIARSCVYAHDTITDGGGYGQNIAAGAPQSDIASVITDLFYNNEVSNFDALYGQATPSSIDNEAAFDGWGHFTQIVWVSSEHVGCATVDCSETGLANTGGSVPPHFTVCNYAPAGNFVGDFHTNVREPLEQPSISGETQL